MVQSFEGSALNSNKKAIVNCSSLSNKSINGFQKQRSGYQRTCLIYIYIYLGEWPK